MKFRRTDWQIGVPIYESVIALWGSKEKKRRSRISTRKTILALTKAGSKKWEGRERATRTGHCLHSSLTKFLQLSRAPVPPFPSQWNFRDFSLLVIKRNFSVRWHLSSAATQSSTSLLSSSFPTTRKLLGRMFDKQQLEQNYNRSFLTRSIPSFATILRHSSM